MELLDINGLYMWDNTIFDNMVIPTDVNREELIDMIIFDCRELTVTVASPVIMKRAIELWSRKNIYYWNELQKTMHYSYNPIENYDRHELTKDVFKSDNKSVENGNNTVTQTGTNTTTETGSRTSVESGSKTRVESGSKTIEQTGTKTTTDELTVAAFNSSSLEPRETHTVTETPNDWVTTETGNDYTVTETPNDYTVTETPNVTTENKPNLTTIETPNLTTKNESGGDNVRESYIHGNIGVKSTQAMIEEQRSIIDISLYTTIVNSFKNEFCILKY